MPKYLSGKVRVNPQDKLSPDRDRYLELGDAEPNFGNPATLGIVNGGSSAGIPAGTRYQSITVHGDTTGNRYWIPVGGGVIPGSISVYEEGVIVGSADSVTQLNFVGNFITAVAEEAVEGETPGNIATITVRPTTNDKEILFSKDVSGLGVTDFSGSSDFTFNYNVGIVSVSTGIHIAPIVGSGATFNVGAGGSVFRLVSAGSTSLVGIGTTNPTQNLDVKGNIKLDGDLHLVEAGTIIDYTGNKGADANILTKGVDGVEWLRPNQVVAGAAQTVSILQYHKTGGILGGTADYNSGTGAIGVALVWDSSNHRVGIGSTQPSTLLDVKGNSLFTGITTFAGITTVTGDTLFTKQLSVSGLSTFSGVIDANDGINASSAKIEDLTANRVVFTSTDGELETSDNITYNSTDYPHGLYVVGLITSRDLGVSGVGTIAGIEIGGENDNEIKTLTGGLVLSSASALVRIDDQVEVNDTTNSFSSIDGALISDGGLGVAKNVNVGGALSITGPSVGIAVTLAAAGGITTTGGDLYIGGDLFVNDDIFLDEGNFIKLIVDSGIATFKGNVHAENHIGFGTTGSSARLAIKKASGPGLDLIPANDTDDFQINFVKETDTTDVRGHITYEFDNDALTFRTGGSGEELRIASDGEVGINSSDPQAKLDVVVSSVNRTWEVAENTVAKFERNGLNRIAIVGGTTSKCQIEFGDTEEINPGFIRYDHADDSMTFKTGGGMRLRITSAGDVGIGTTIPNGRLDVKENRNTDYSATTDQRTSAHIIARNSIAGINNFASISLVSGSEKQAEASINLIETDDYLGDIAFKSRTGNSTWTEKLRITSGGYTKFWGTRDDVLQPEDDDNLQIYTKSADNSINRGSGITFYNHDNSGYEMGGTIQVAKENGTADNEAAYMRFSTRPAGAAALERLRIDSSGNIGIGTTGGMNDDANRLVVGSGIDNQGITIYSGQNVGDYGSIYFADGKVGAASSRGQIRYEQNNEVMSFYTNNDERLRITKDGDVGIGTDNPINGNAATLNNTATLAVGTVKAGNLEGTYTVTGETGQVLFNSSDLLTAASNLYWDEPNDRLGIGTVSPDSILHVAKTESTAWPFATPDTSTNKRYQPYLHELVIENYQRDTTDSFAGIFFKAGSDANDEKISSARIAAINGGDHQTSLAFATRTSGSGTPFEERLRITSAGDVGIGTINPSFSSVNEVSAADVKGLEIFKGGTDTATALKLGGDNGSGIKAWSQLGYSGENSTAHWANYNTEGVLQGEIVVGAAGSVGINTTNPRFGLDIVNNSNSYNNDASLRLYNHETGESRDTVLRFQIAGTDSANYIYFGDGDDTNAGQIVYSHSVDAMRFFVNSPIPDASEGERLRITSDGDVGIGTINPTSTDALTNNETTLAVGIVTANTVYGALVGDLVGSATLVKTTKNDSLDTGYLTFVDGNNDTAADETINTSTNFGIDSTKGILKLPKTNGGIKFGPGDATNDDAHIEWLGANNAGVLRISTSDDSGTEYIEFGDYDLTGGYHTDSQQFTQWLKLYRTGADLTGTLDVSGATNFNDTTDATNSTTGGAVTIDGGLAVAMKLFVGSNLDVTGTLDVGGNVTLGDDITADTVTFGSTIASHVYPSAHETYNIGESASNRWNQVYAKEYYGLFKGTIDTSVSTFSLNSNVDDIFSVSDNELSADDATAHKLVIWDDTNDKLTYAGLGTGLSFSGTDLNSTTYELTVPDATTTIRLDPSTGSNNDITLTGGTNCTVAHTSTTEITISATDTTTNNLYLLKCLQTGSPTPDDNNPKLSLQTNGGSGSTYTEADSVTINGGTNCTVTRDADDGSLTIDATDNNDNTTYAFDLTRVPAEEDPVTSVTLALDSSSGDSDTIQFVKGNGITFTSVTTGDTSAFTINASDQAGTTYDLDVAESTTSITLTGSDSTSDAIEIAGSGGISITRNTANKLTIDGADVEGSVQTFAQINTPDGNNVAAGNQTITFAQGGGMSITENNDTITFSSTNTNTEYAFDCVTTTTANAAKLRLNPTGSGANHDVEIVGADSITITRNDNHKLTIGGGGGGGGTPGGSDTEIQFNDDGSFGGSSKLKWDNDSKKLIFGNDTDCFMQHVSKRLIIANDKADEDDPTTYDIQLLAPIIYANGDILPYPGAPNTDARSLGGIYNRWENVYVNDLQLSNESKKDKGGNDVDGTWGDYTIQEGEENLYLINNRNGKKYKFNLTEVKD